MFPVVGIDLHRRLRHPLAYPLLDFGKVNGIAVAHRPDHVLAFVAVHSWHVFHVAERKAQRERAVRDIPDKSGELSLALLFDEFGLGPQHRRQGASIAVRYAPRELDRGVGGKAFLELGRQLTDILVRQNHADILFAGLFENQGDIGVEVVLRLIDIDKRRRAIGGMERGALLRRLGDHRDEEAAEDLGAVLLEKFLRGVDQDHLADIHLGKEVEFVARMREHPFEGLVFENAPRAGARPGVWYPRIPSS